MGVDISLICPHCRQEVGDSSVYITYNISKMVEDLGVKDILWDPQDNGIIEAEQLITPLSQAIARLEESPNHYKTYDSPNGWGTYDSLLKALRKLENACIQNPKAAVSVWR